MDEQAKDAARQTIQRALGIAQAPPLSEWLTEADCLYIARRRFDLIFGSLAWVEGDERTVQLKALSEMRQLLDWKEAIINQIPPSERAS